MIYYENKGIRVRTSDMLDVDMMKKNLRKADVMEVWASHHHDPEIALRLSFELSTFCLTVEDKGEPIAMFGVAPETLLSDKGTVWLLATDGICKIRRQFLRQSRKYIDMMLEMYPLLENHVDARNVVSIEWLKWCGADIEEAKPWGVEKQKFNYFSFRRKTCAIPSL